ncbi:MAG: hypothetical protein M3Y33_06045 [Actinomycetota bacterium]|nr:hypothetical protein [Actinomycetota bacterium]
MLLDSRGMRPRPDGPAAMEGQRDADGREDHCSDVGDPGFESGDRRNALDRQNEGVLRLPAHRRGGRGENGQGRDRAGQPRDGPVAGSGCSA